MTSKLAMIAAALLLTAAASAPVDFIRKTPEQLIWQTLPDSHGVMAAIVTGDPSKPGVYVMRVRFPPHVMDRPHRHSQDRHVTVLQGVWSAGTGSRFDPAAATVLPAGSYMFHPADAVHWDGSNGPEAVVVQITGTGPVSSSDDDPALPAWVKLPN